MQEDEPEVYSELDEIMNHQEHFIESELGEVYHALKGELEIE